MSFTPPLAPFISEHTRQATMFSSSGPSHTKRPQGNSDLQSPRRLSQGALNAGLWSSEEDDRLREAVVKHGPRWVAAAGEVGTRNGEQCAKRWNDHINPELKRSPWSADEDRTLLALVALHGHNWKLMANAHMQSRSSLSLKNRYSLLMRRQKRDCAKQKQQQQQQQQRQQQQLPNSHPTFMSATPPSDVYYSPRDHDLAASRLENPTTTTSSYSTSTESAFSEPNHFDIDLSNIFSTVQGSRALKKPPTDGDMGQTPIEGHERAHAWDDAELHRLMCGADMTVRPAVADDALLDLAPRDEDGIGADIDQGVEFSVTCSRARLKAMVCHAFEGALLETAGLPEGSPVTVTLRLKR